MDQSTYQRAHDAAVRLRAIASDDPEAAAILDPLARAIGTDPSDEWARLLVLRLTDEAEALLERRAGR